MEYGFSEKLFPTTDLQTAAVSKFILSLGRQVCPHRGMCACVFIQCLLNPLPVPQNEYPLFHKPDPPIIVFVLKASCEYVHLFAFLPIPHQMKNCLPEINASSSTFYFWLIIFPEEICHPWALSLLCGVNRSIETVFLFYFK